jgi:hypothetical protein
MECKFILVELERPSLALMPSEVTLVNEYVNRTVNKLIQRSLGSRTISTRDIKCKEGLQRYNN